MFNQNECKRIRSVNIDDRSVKEQEYRKISRMWEKAARKHSATTVSDPSHDASDKECRYGRSRCQPPQAPGEECEDEVKESPAAIQRRNAKMKSFGKRKTPLQKFDEVVSRELMNRQVSDEESVYDWPRARDFVCGKVSATIRKTSIDAKMSKTTLSNIDREMKSQNQDPSGVEDAALMDAIEKLIQAQESCRFDAAVKAAEAAASSVPPEMAEEVAVACAKDYRSKIIDIVNEKVGAGDGRKPMEIIGYIGITKKKGADDDDD